MRLNTLVMPHARITGKGAVVLSTEVAKSLLKGVETAPLVQPGLPIIDPTAKDADFSYRLLLVMYDPVGPRYFHANFNDFQNSPDATALIERANALFSKTVTTYRVGDRERKTRSAP
jgi:hypothetical protein